MAFTTNVVAQNGNSTALWTVSGGGISDHEAIVANSSAGNSGLRIENITVFRNPTRYDITMRVVGAGAMSFAFSGETMD